ncbi:aminopeptidase [Luteitalea sp. TBR-22]|uniref:M28 family metallopeptidase n=1 Tax=Luteitalea sp. TBR-22 TaxID=2802971 RepID=UPI001AF1A35A|nr:M28 family metallopeptidase [Luteitalea sp. TBR-22]BCS32274.1 aminopeptidase [Luteitalea sp. TBR-22]
MKHTVALLFLPLALAAACSREPAPAAPASAPTAARPTPLADLPAVDGARLLEQIRALSSDEFQGRKPGTEGEVRTVAYLEQQFKALGLQPGNTDGTYVQDVRLVGLTPAQKRPFTVTGGGKRATFAWRDEVVAWSKHVADTASIENSELLFVGYGVTAPEFDWNDFKDVDIKGKTIVVLVNDPQVPSATDPTTLDDNVFGGRAMTYYGRWTYKYEEAARRGAAGVLIVHETGPAGYPFSVVQGNLGERLDLVREDKGMSRASIEGWLSLDAARKLMAMAGQDLDALKKQALTRSFRPVPLGLSASMTIGTTARTMASKNVLAKLEGSDPALKDEYVIYTAHWDHFGVGEPVDGDRIYNGALDNASGTALVLELARAFTQVTPKPRRSVVFLLVTAEEQGLLGSAYYAEYPVYPLAKTVAVVNIDGINQWGRTRDLTVIGLGASQLDDYLREAATEQGRTLRPDPESEKGYYYRSDHFNFAKKGVPALYLDSGIEYVGKDASYGTQKRDEYTNRDYHSPSDEVKEDWDLTGAVEDARVLFAVGYRVANAATWPEWAPGNEFRAAREQMRRP